MDFNFDYFANFNFAYFKIEESLGLVWLNFGSFESFGKIWVKIAERSIRLENFHFGARFTSYGFAFCSFWI